MDGRGDGEVWRGRGGERDELWGEDYDLEGERGGEHVDFPLLFAKI